MLGRCVRDERPARAPTRPIAAAQSVRSELHSPRQESTMKASLGSTDPSDALYQLLEKSDDLILVRLDRAKHRDQHVIVGCDVVAT